MKKLFIIGVFLGLLGAYIAGNMYSAPVEWKIGLSVGMIGVYIIGIATGIEEAKK